MLSLLTKIHKKIIRWNIKSLSLPINQNFKKNIPTYTIFRRKKIQMKININRHITIDNMITIRLKGKVLKNKKNFLKQIYHFYMIWTNKKTII
jgi:hypothetical protein